MSSHVILGEEEKARWMGYIHYLHNVFINTELSVVLQMLIIQLYEFTVACCDREEGIPVKLKQLKDAFPEDETDLQRFIKVLFDLRNILCHRPCSPQVHALTQSIFDTSETVLLEFALKFFDEHFAHELVSDLKKVNIMLGGVKANKDLDCQVIRGMSFEDIAKIANS